MTFNMALTVKIEVLAACHVKHTVNGARRAALGAIEGEIPTITAAVTVMTSEVTSKVNMKGSVCELFHKLTVLQKKIMIKSLIKSLIVAILVVLFAKN